VVDIACTYPLPFPTDEQKRHWLRMRIRRLRAHIETLQDDLARMEAELKAMEEDEAVVH
jgi:CHAD domain-containing protein